MMQKSNLRIAAMIPAALSLLSPAAQARDAGPRASEPALSAGFRFVEMSGEELFAGVCRGCHMSDAKGATGAGAYPSLASDHNLAAGEYPIGIVLHGQRAMPPFGAMMSNDQVAAVVNYLRTHFGNEYTDAVKAEDVRAARR
jgi:mono/diheme cytochrome c family protein